ncbi:MAG: hypothetical protein DRJ65_22590, partial [Acidobacteria bacterium]
ETVLTLARPSFASLQVMEIVMTSATVTALSLEELQQRGINLNQGNYQAFSFAVGFAFEGETVVLDLPLLFGEGGSVDPLGGPAFDLSGLSPETQAIVERWQPPGIVPFAFASDGVDYRETGEDPFEELQLPLFGAIVLPGNVSFLNQFFEARLIVANGAPIDSEINLGDLSARLSFSDAQVLRLASTEPPVAPGQDVPLLTEDFQSEVLPARQASAAWTIEGLVPGTHSLNMDITGVLRRPGKDPWPIRGRTQAVVDVVDARFHLTFTHPDVVREGMAYSLGVTMTNLSRATQYGISVALMDNNIVGAHKADPADDFMRTISELAPGHSETLMFALVPDLTGRVVATSFQSTSPSGQGSFELVTGIGELGIPLSPATLVLPRFSERLNTPFTWSGDFYQAFSRFLGLAYSLAVAPSGALPAETPRVIRRDVETRAADVAFAGQRTFLGDGLLESLEVLSLELLGNRDALVDFDALRRTADSGNVLDQALGDLLLHVQDARDFDAAEFFDHFQDTVSYADPFAAVMLLPEIGSSAPELELYHQDEGQWLGLAGGFAEETENTLPFAAYLPVHQTAGGATLVPMAVIGHVELDQIFDIAVRNSGSQMQSLRLLMLIPNHEGRLRRVEIEELELPPGSFVGVSVGGDIPGPGQGGFVFRDGVTGVALSLQPSVVVSDVVLPPFRLIGARQDFGLQKARSFGDGVSYLFNRPPTDTISEYAAAFEIHSVFDGLDTSDQNVHREGDLRGKAAFLQPSGRVVNLRFDGPLCALVDPSDQSPLVVHAHSVLVDDIEDRFGEILSGTVPEILLETDPEHFGGLLSGRVLRGTGDGVEGATVQLLRSRDPSSAGLGPGLLIVAETQTTAEGSFFFEFVEDPHPDPTLLRGFKVRATIPAGADPDLNPAEISEVSSAILRSHRLAEINIALLGRGTIQGELLESSSGLPVEDGVVIATSTLFNIVKTVDADPDGGFFLPGMPVGPVTLTGKSPDGRVVYQTVNLAEPGDVVEAHLELPEADPPQGFGSVVVTVEYKASGEPAPDPVVLSGAEVRLYIGSGLFDQRTTGSQGLVFFENVPAGRMTLQAAHWDLSRSAAEMTLDVPQDTVVEARLTLRETGTKTVTGTVLFYDPITDSNVPVEEAAVYISGPGVFAFTDSNGDYVLEGVPVQAPGGGAYRVEAIDQARNLHGAMDIGVLSNDPPGEIHAPTIILREMRGGIRGVVLDPLGRPASAVSIVFVNKGVPLSQGAVTGADGSFSIDNIPLAEWEILAHVGSGLDPPRIGWLGSAETEVLYGGHQPFVTVRLGGAGTVRIHTSTGTSTGIQSLVYYKPYRFSEVSYSLGLSGVFTESQTDPNGDLELMLPVGPFQLSVFNPFHGIREISGALRWNGEVKEIDIVFEDASTVTGRVVDVDGMTPIAGAQVVLESAHLAPQTQISDALGQFRFELVPGGAVRVWATATVGSVDRVGLVSGQVSNGGQELQLEVRLKAQGTVRGRIVESVNGVTTPVAFARFYALEQTFPNRRVPEGQGWLVTDDQGRFEVAALTAGGISVIGKHPVDDRRGSTRGDVVRDWDVVELPDIVLSEDFGAIEVLVRDPETGVALPDCQVKLTGGGLPGAGVGAVTDSQGKAVYEALPLGGFGISVFHAPTGRSGRQSAVLAEPGERRELVVFVDQRGEISGTLFDDQARTNPVSSGIVDLSGTTAGGSFTAVD